ncbi:type II toxin-antitoxin system VapC family toxin [Thermococcus thermotolerans]|uniref:type II toxin-antitoxin system VapC family toxin n=1 Tax=Thermococcus thermotolerans TaxID=2969672 RepID=UPI0021583676|nr:type II toxin-antitoxin system VapC family toxin [Thermococcus thermotolerans]
MGVVIDSSVVLKALLPPPRNLDEEILKRELEAHEKCQFILETIEEKRIEIHSPAVIVVEVAGVIRRITGDEYRASIASDTIEDNFILHYDAEILEKAREVATLTGASGFDAYFIATARLLNLPLITDDRGMHLRARKLEIESLLVRENSIREIERVLR